MEKLVAIPPFELQQDAALPFHLFVKLPVTNRVILYRREGSAIDQGKLDRSNSRPVDFFVEAGQYDKYLQYATKEFMNLLTAKPANTLQIRKVAGEMLTSAFGKENAAESRELIRSIGDLINGFVGDLSQVDFADRKNLFKRFSDLAKTGTNFQKHPQNVATLAVMISLGLGLHDQRTLVEIALAAVMHDIGLTQLPRTVIAEAHQYRDVSTVSRSFLKTHPQGSLDLLRNRGIEVSKLMETMILQHHEEYSGNGYPQGLVGEAVHPMALILHVADDLDELLGESGAKIAPRLRHLFLRYEHEKVLSPSLHQKLKDLLLS